MSRRVPAVFLAAAAVALLGLVPAAEGRNAAKFKISSISGSTTSTRDGVYVPDGFTSCSFTQTEKVSFHSTKPITGYAFSSKAHGSGRIAWSPTSDFSGNLLQLEIPGEVTVTRSATYDQVNYTDPDTGEVFPGCSHEIHLDGTPASDCTFEKTFEVTLALGGTSDLKRSTYVFPDIAPRDLDALDRACETVFTPSTTDPRLFSKADLFNRKRKRLSDSDRVQEPIAQDFGDQTITGSIVNELQGTIKRKR